jgi:hypothetical protein
MRQENVMKIQSIAIAIITAITLPVIGCDETHPIESSSAPLARISKRSIQEFVDAQGTFCFPDGIGGCVQFVPPIDNFFGWGTSGVTRSASIDYAGLANKWIEGASGGTRSFGTTFDGTVNERELSDGRALVSVSLHTRNALSWAVEGGNYAGGTLLFGYRAPDVLSSGRTPALGESLLKVEFTMPAVGMPLPDLFKIVVDPDPGMELRSLSMRAHADGVMHTAAGVAEGTPGHLTVSQTGLFNVSGRGATADGFPAELVEIRATGR